ncbi:unnamed protein product, partial [Polarella glacialis]
MLSRSWQPAKGWWISWVPFVGTFMAHTWACDIPSSRKISSLSSQVSVGLADVRKNKLAGDHSSPVCRLESPVSVLSPAGLTNKPIAGANGDIRPCNRLRFLRFASVVYPDAVAVGVSDPETATNSGIAVADAFAVGVSDPETATGSAVTVTPSGPVFDTLSWRKDSKVLSCGDLSRYPWGMMMGIANAIGASGPEVTGNRRPSKRVSNEDPPKMEEANPPQAQSTPLRGGLVQLRPATGSSQLDLQAGPEPPQLDLLLAMPRPKVMMRLWSVLAQLGFRRIAIANACRVEKPYFSSQATDLTKIEPELLEGLEQAVCTRLPE